jgi:hypothetical protein
VQSRLRNFLCFVHVHSEAGRLEAAQDLDALLRLMGIELEEREAAKWERLRSDLEMVEANQ